jgi:hypothetical protein
MRSLPPHKHVLRLLGACTRDAAHFQILLEFCEHGSLYNRLRAETKASTLLASQQLAWAIAACEGVLHLHEVLVCVSV